MNKIREVLIVAMILLSTGIPVLHPATTRPAHQSGADHASVFPRTITPNGDGINDLVFFMFSNPTAAQVRGAVYDLKSAKVVDIKENQAIFAGTNSVLSWDGRDDSGSAVPAGIYLYKIEIGDQTYTGAVGVAK